MGVEHCDGDGDSITPSEGDCDDADPSRFPGAREFCDGIDNNCNQEVDEGYSLGFPCMVGKGECHDEGELVCSSSKTTVACSASVKEKEAEICDGRDNDCDGQVDEEIATELCDLQDGVCQGAQKYCGGKLGYLVCGAGEYDADYEIEETSCDGKDNDCDGQVDENSLCQQNETRPCGIDTGECQKGTQSCSSGKWASCSGAKPPKAELCNGKDDD